MAILEQNGFYPRTREEYIVEEGIRTKRIVRDILFISDEQIRLARRSVSGFIYETDATFNTNTRRLPLAVMVGINNTGHTFPMAFMFITSESAKCDGSRRIGNSTRRRRAQRYIRLVNCLTKRTN
jgi:MULE transposase domain